VVYVPMPVQPPESPRVRELSQKIQQLIADFQRQYPMTPAEIREALFHAAGHVGGAFPRRLVAVLLGGVAAMLGVGVLVTRGGAEGTGITIAPIIVAVGVAAAAVGLVAAARRGR